MGIELAKEYSTSQTTISRIINGEHSSIVGMSLLNEDIIRQIIDENCKKMQLGGKLNPKIKY